MSRDLHGDAFTALSDLRSCLGRMAAPLSDRSDLTVLDLVAKNLRTVDQVITDHQEWSRIQAEMAEREQAFLESTTFLNLTPESLLTLVHPTEGHEHGEHTHTHEEWTPDRLVERLQRMGLCGHRVQAPDRVVQGEKTIPGPASFCMLRADVEHSHD